MSPSLHHLLAAAFSTGRIVFCIFLLYTIWPRKRHWIQGFKKVTPQGIPVELTPGYFDFRSRLVLCVFVSAALCFVLGDLFRRTFLPPAPPQAMAAADPTPAPPPKIARSSPARAGDTVKIVCAGDLCAAAATASDAAKLSAGQPPSGKVFSVQNGTKAIVTGYDPQDTGSDTAEVFLVAGPHAGTAVWVPGGWMHKTGE